LGAGDGEAKGGFSRDDRPAVETDHSDASDVMYFSEPDGAAEGSGSDASILVLSDSD
jgi:hypothetical protein